MTAGFGGLAPISLSGPAALSVTDARRFNDVATAVTAIPGRGQGGAGPASGGRAVSPSADQAQSPPAYLAGGSLCCWVGLILATLGEAGGIPC